MKSQKMFFILIISIVIIGIGAGIFYSKKQVSTPGKYDTFAQCLKDSGATFYGAFWCPHCQNSKKLFEKSAKLLPYVECSTPNGQGQLPICKEKGIESYPTWNFGKEITIKETPQVTCGAGDTSSEACKNLGSQKTSSWIFSRYTIKSATAPIIKDGTYTFDKDALATAEFNFADLSAFSGCTAPQE